MLEERRLHREAGRSPIFQLCQRSRSVAALPALHLFRDRRM